MLACAKGPKTGKTKKRGRIKRKNGDRKTGTHLFTCSPLRSEGLNAESKCIPIHDVGQGEVEEIDQLKPGEASVNFGWNILEGTQEFAGVRII